MLSCYIDECHTVVLTKTTLRKQVSLISAASTVLLVPYIRKVKHQNNDKTDLLYIILAQIMQGHLIILQFPTYLGLHGRFKVTTILMLNLTNHHTH